jgi:uncharacterized membrane protein YcgQ (UPF0703/DUF1980 family)
MIGANMFIFTTLVFIERLLGGDFLMASIIFLVLLVLIIHPYYQAKRRGHDLKRLSEFIKDDLFLMSFSFSFIIVGSVIAITLVALQIL